jgi:hypothetical protein
MTELQPSSACPCGSGRKYKKCCSPLDGIEKIERDEEKRELVRRAEGSSFEIIIKYAIKNSNEDYMDEILPIYTLGYEELLLPSGSSEKQDFDFYYIAQLYIMFRFPYTEFNGANFTYAEYVLEQHPKLFRNDQATFIKVLAKEKYRWVVITDILHGNIIKITDLETSECFEIIDRDLSQSAKKGLIFLSQVIKMYGNYYLVGACNLALPGNMAGDLLRRKDELLNSPEDLQVLKDTYKITKIIQDDVIQRITFLECLDFYIQSMKSPTLTNTDGELMEAKLIEYKLTLDHLQAYQLVLNSSKQFKPSDNNSSSELYWYGGRPKKNAFGEPYIKAAIKFLPSKLEIEVNSEKRAKKVCKLVENVLIDHIEYVTDHEISTHLGSSPETKDNSLISDEMIQNYYDQYYSKWLDMSIPALGGLTPRQASKDPKFKNALEALLLEIEANHDKSDKSEAKPNISFIRAQLNDKLD